MKNLEPHKIVLNQLKNLVNTIPVNEFTAKCDILYNASIGEHFRHIIEFYRCCLFNRIDGIVNYDLRPRDKALETNPSIGIKAIEKIIDHLKKLSDPHKTDLRLQLECIIDPNGIPTNLERELAFCMDHCIHHQSIIKVGLKARGLESLVDKNFGVAFSTQRYREKCVS
ncbi:MAG: hypothetical protein OXC03_09030 [Flavobacteriaceae bacterium]|nr:hypothetical protein [Flavobacteriaceae bacterium]